VQIVDRQRLTIIATSPNGGTFITNAPMYVQRVDPTPILMTTNRKKALVMGKFRAKDAVNALQTSRCSPELVSVQVAA
jgi:hypothetical protein